MKLKSAALATISLLAAMTLSSCRHENSLGSSDSGHLTSQPAASTTQPDQKKMIVTCVIDFAVLDLSSTVSVDLAKCNVNHSDFNISLYDQIMAAKKLVIWQHKFPAGTNPRAHWAYTTEMRFARDSMEITIVENVKDGQQRNCNSDYCVINAINKKVNYTFCEPPRPCDFTIDKDGSI